jgi:hypothetical protein
MSLLPLLNFDFPSDKPVIVWATRHTDSNGFHGEKMDGRPSRPEDDLSEIKTRLTKVETRLEMTATREDLHKEINAQTWKLITLGIALCSAVYYIVKHLQ